MPILSHNHHFDIYNAVIGKQVRQFQRVKITDEEAALINQNGIWIIEPDPKPKRTPRSAATLTSTLSGKRGERR